MSDDLQGINVDNLPELVAMLESSDNPIILSNKEYRIWAVEEISRLSEEWRDNISEYATDCDLSEYDRYIRNCLCELESTIIDRKKMELLLQNFRYFLDEVIIDSVEDDILLSMQKL